MTSKEKTLHPTPDTLHAKLRVNTYSNLIPHV